MNPSTMESDSAERAPARQLDVFIRAGLVAVLAVLCYRILSPFLGLIIWSIILAVTLYPVHQALARRVGGRQWLASTILVVAAVLLLVVPPALLMNSFADSVRNFIDSVQNNTLEIPPPRAGVEDWPIVGERVHELWSRAHADLPAFVQSLQPKIGQVARQALGMVARIGGG